jgi:aspartyl-tRNA(Asn)/glutamyl-tRNA(Gln) amidotransferase subunit C
MPRFSFVVRPSSLARSRMAICAFRADPLSYRQRMYTAAFTSNKEQPMAITIAEVEHVAHLARLRLSAEELEKMRTDLSAILDHIDLLKEVDVSDVAPTAQVTDLFNVMRDDAVRPSLPREDVLANAPDQRDGMFRVKAIFEE